MTGRESSFASGKDLHGNSQDERDRRQYDYPTIPNLKSLPPAHLGHSKRLSEGQRTEETRVQSSFSTESGSSHTSYQKRETPSPDSQWPSPTLERTLVDSNHYVPSSHTKQDRSLPRRSGRNSVEPEMRETNSPALTYIRERRQIEQEEDEDDEDEGDHALWVLFWLSVLDPLHSLASCLFTLIVACGLVVAFPIRLVHRHSSFGDQLIRSIAPLFKHHLEMMYASSVNYAFEWDFRPGMLIFVHLIAPLISIGVAIASWVTAAFWVFTSIMGNPDGTERRDDGADAVLAIRNWWEGCLLMAIRPRINHSMRSIV